MRYDARNNRSWSSGGQGRKQGYTTEAEPQIEIPLAKHYCNKGQMLLPNGTADVYAGKFRNITNHQLRKILDQIKNFKSQSGIENFEKVRSQLFFLLPMAAYNAGRDRNLKPLYDFLHRHINEKSICEKQDLDVLDELFTSIIAYHAYNKVKG